MTHGCFVYWVYTWNHHGVWLCFLLFCHACSLRVFGAMFVRCSATCFYVQKKDLCFMFVRCSAQAIESEAWWHPPAPKMPTKLQRNEKFWMEIEVSVISSTDVPVGKCDFILGSCIVKQWRCRRQWDTWRGYLAGILGWDTHTKQRIPHVNP